MCNTCWHGWLLSKKPVNIACLQGKGLDVKKSCPSGCIESVVRLSTDKDRQTLVLLLIKTYKNII